MALFVFKIGLSVFSVEIFKISFKSQMLFISFLWTAGDHASQGCKGHSAEKLSWFLNFFQLISFSATLDSLLFTAAKIQCLTYKPYQNSDWIEDCFEFSIVHLRQVESVKVYCNHWRCSLQGCVLHVAVPSGPWCLSLILLLVVLEVLGHSPWVRTGWPIQSSHKENFTINQDGPARFVYSWKVYMTDKRFLVNELSRKTY